MFFLREFAIWGWAIALGYLLCRRVLPTDSPWLTAGSSLPVGLVTILGVCFPLAQLIGHPVGWVTGIVFLGMVTVYLGFRSWKTPTGKLSAWALSRAHWAWLSVLLLVSNFVMHTEEVRGPEDDYWVHFPLLSLLNRGDFPPPNPFFPDLTLHGHFGRDYLIALFGWLAGGGEALISTLWSFNHLLMISSVLLTFGLGKRERGPAGAFLLSVFLFFGISVGSRVGLADTYDNNNLLVYCLILVFIAFETSKSKSLIPDLFLAPALGVYGIIYETHLLLFLMVIWAGPLLWRRPNALSLRAWKRPLGISVVAVLIAALLGGPIQDLALRATGLGRVQADQGDVYQSQQVHVSFPKKEFLQILIGPESYRRLSYVYQGRAFANAWATDGEAGMEARQDYQYAFIFGPKVLMMHWLALYLGLPAGLLLILRRDSEAGQTFWLFGLASYLVPGLVNFGIHEKEYFRWEFAAGFGFAGALGLALAILWKDGRTWKRFLVVVLAMLVIVGGERKVNRSIIDIQRLKGRERSRALKPWYPSPRRWILDSEKLRMTPDLLEASRALHRLSKPSDRLVVSLDPRSHWDLFQESTVAGLAGLRSIGHLTTPPWMPDGITPFFRTAAWNVFWQTRDARVLPSLGAQWLMCDRPDLEPELSKIKTLERVETYGGVSLWKYLGDLQPCTTKPEPGVRLLSLNRPPDEKLASEVALPVDLSLSKTPKEPFDLAIRWVPLAESAKEGPQEPPLTLRCQPGEQSYRHYLVAPLVEGDYNLEILVNGAPIDTGSVPMKVRFDWSSQAAKARIASLDENRAVFVPGGPFLAPPLTLGLRLFRIDADHYNRPFGFEAKGIWEGDNPVTLQPVDDGYDFKPNDNLRVDIFLVDRSGREVRIFSSK